MRVVGSLGTTNYKKGEEARSVESPKTSGKSLTSNIIVGQQGSERGAFSLWFKIILIGGLKAISRKKESLPTFDDMRDPLKSKSKGSGSRFHPSSAVLIVEETHGLH